MVAGGPAVIVFRGQLGMGYVGKTRILIYMLADRAVRTILLALSAGTCIRFLNARMLPTDQFSGSSVCTCNPRAGGVLLAIGEYCRATSPLQHPPMGINESSIAAPLPCFSLVRHGDGADLLPISRYVDVGRWLVPR